MSTMGLEVSPISPAGLHPCVLVMFALFQQRALVSREVVWIMDGFDNGQDEVDFISFSDSVTLFWTTRTSVVPDIVKESAHSVPLPLDLCA